MRAERDRRAVILTAEGIQAVRRSSRPRVAARPTSFAPRATSRPPCCGLRVRPRPSRRSSTPSTPATPTSKLLAYQYLQTLPKIAESASQQALDHPERVHRGAQGHERRVRRLDHAASPSGRRPSRGTPDAEPPVAVTHPWFEGIADPRVLAHRGLLTPEDAAHGWWRTLSPRSRRRMPPVRHYVESDCHLTADGVVVLFHD